MMMKKRRNETRSESKRRTKTQETHISVLRRRCDGGAHKVVTKEASAGWLSAWKESRIITKPNNKEYAAELRPGCIHVLHTKCKGERRRWLKEKWKKQKKLLKGTKTAALCAPAWQTTSPALAWITKPNWRFWKRVWFFCQQLCQRLARVQRRRRQRDGKKGKAAQ